MRVVWTESALNDIGRFYIYLQQFNPIAAMTVAERLMAAGDSLETLPRRGRSPVGTGIRELVTAYPYVIRYRVEGDVVVVLRVRHTSRRPTGR